ncbi:hypothetical protein SAMN05421786_105159 [Chryseobacterium ureilyticum]|uniref:Uncharacterized protein n=1 Tax=Chryseobacterium ureilyticum TaxID=373668 RepID=A0A1N7PGF4_9FLAO|nr:hypothetical protein [Chryseobacterium ureilyticum]SIT09694.1 hypothetical protein SAMN05421786_105159 [Chryseobacterium ureilyticum]
MRKAFMLLFALASFAAYSQISIPESSEKGIIITQTNQTIHYKKLSYTKGKVTYINTQNGEEEFLYDNSVKGIQEEGKIAVGTMSSESLTETVKNQDTKLTVKKDIKNYLIQKKDPQYMKGRTLNNIGTGLVVGGAACFVIGGLSNVSKANDNSVKNGDSKGSPIPLIIGLIGAGTGVVFKLVGHSQMKEAMNNYSTADIKRFKPDYYVLNDRNGVGLMMKF